MWRSGSVLLGLLCAACASPSSQEAAKFGQAATATLTIITDARSTDIDLMRETGIEQRTYNYLTTGTMALDRPLDSKAEKLIAEQIDLLTSLSDYANALAQATDPKGNADLEAAAAKLPGATSALFTSIPSSTSSPLVGPVVTLVSSVAVDVVELETRDRLRRVIETAEPFLEVAVNQIIIDNDKVQNMLGSAYHSWIRAKEKNLSILRQNYGVAYSAYKDADSVSNGFKQRLSTLNRDTLGKTLIALETTHKALLSNDIDFSAAFADFTKIAGQLRTITQTKSK
jgi:hypothetical protein